MIISLFHISNVGDIEVYWAFKLFLIFTLLWCGWAISYKNPNNKYYNCYAAIVITVYSIIEGLRWERGVDYHNYYLELTGYWQKENMEPFYRLIVDIESSILPYWMVFILYSAFLMTSFMLVLKNFPKTAIWALPLFFLITESGAENLVRQFIAISFFLLGYNAYLNGKKRVMMICFIAVPLIHLSGIFVLFMFGLCSMLKLDERMSKPWLLLGIYVVLYIVWDISNLSEYTKYLSMINIASDTHLEGYLENADRWFTEEGSISLLHGEKGIASLANLIFKLLINLVIIYFGFYECKNNEQMRIPYWFTYISIIIQTIGGDIEIYNRLANWLYYLIPLVVGGFLTTIPMNKWEKKIVYFIVFMAYFYPLIRNIGNMPYSGCAFVWDRI